MKIIYTKRFDKQFRKLPHAAQLAVTDTVALFVLNPFDSRLDNHQLHGKLKGRRALTVAFDLRILFEQYDGYAVVYMLSVGTHQNVYGKS